MDDIEIFVKEAREKSVWLREHLHPEGLKRMFAEGLISQYAEKMEMLRKIDDAIYAWTQDLDLRIKQMKTDISANRLIDLSRHLIALDNLLRGIVIEGNKIKDITEQEIHEFDLSMPKYAGLFDDWKRKWVYEKLQTQTQKDRKKDLSNLITTTENIIKTIKIYLKKMGTARAHGEIGQYINYIQEIAKHQNQFHSLFVINYNKYLKPLVDEIHRRNAEEKAKAQADEILMKQKAQENQNLTAAPPPVQQLPNIPELVSPVKTSPVIPDLSPQQNPLLPKPIRIKAPVGLGTQLAPKDEEKVEPEEIAEPMNENTQENEEPEPTKLTASLSKYLLRKQHCDFLDQLIRLASTNSKEVPLFILNYSEKIENQDPKASLKLIAIAEGLIG